MRPTDLIQQPEQPRLEDLPEPALTRATALLRQLREDGYPEQEARRLATTQAVEWVASRGAPASDVPT